MSDLKPGAVQLNNAAECFGFILSFLAYWSDGKWHDAEVEVMYSAVASTLKNLELDTDNEVINQFDLNSIMESLFKRGIQSMIVEGGAYTIQKFIDSDKWDCIRVFKSEKNLYDGVVAPKYEIDKLEYRLIGDDKFYEIFKN